MNKTSFSGLFRATADEKHPLQSIIEFVFTDFNPNKNKQGVEESEADNIIRTGANQPVKMNFLGDAVANHENAIPVGTILELYKDQDKILGRGILWKNEYKDEVMYLEQASTNEGGVQFSWELYYKDTIHKEDTDWLQDVVTGAITIVSTPAYSGRTPLLSIAEDLSGAESVGGLMADQTMEVLTEQVSSLTDRLYAMVSALYEALDEARISSSTVDVEQLSTEFTDLMAKLKAMRSDASVALSEAHTELEVLRTYKAEKEAAEARSALTETRVAALSAVMSEEDIQAKLDFILGLSEDIFTEFVASLQTVRQKSATSSLHKTTASGVPDFTSTAVVSPISMKDVARAFLSERGKN